MLLREEGVGDGVEFGVGAGVTLDPARDAVEFGSAVWPMQPEIRLGASSGLVHRIRPIPDERLGRNIGLAGPDERPVVHEQASKALRISGDRVEDGPEEQIRDVALDHCPIGQCQSDGSTFERFRGFDLEHRLQC